MLSGETVEEVTEENAVFRGTEDEDDEAGCAKNAEVAEEEAGRSGDVPERVGLDETDDRLMGVASSGSGMLGIIGELMEGEVEEKQVDAVFVAENAESGEDGDAGVMSMEEVEGGAEGVVSNEPVDAHSARSAGVEPTEGS